MLFEPIKNDLTFEEFIEFYDQDVYTAYMETGCSYEMEYEDFEELEYQAYLEAFGQWTRDSVKTEIDKPIQLEA